MVNIHELVFKILVRRRVRIGNKMIKVNREKKKKNTPYTFSKLTINAVIKKARERERRKREISINLISLISLVAYNTSIRCNQETIKQIVAQLHSIGSILTMVTIPFFFFFFIIIDKVYKILKATRKNKCSCELK